MSLSPGTSLGPYEIVGQLGQGGMGVVYTAHDPRLKRTVAIKLLPPDLTRDDTAKQRLLQEAQAASALDHPNICTIYEINETDDDQLYLVMACYEGETLKERITRGPLDLSDAIDIATQVGEGLAKAHAAGIVHRDIKPANLMVTKDGTIKILDFGLAKLTGAEGVTQTATTVGTVAYMSPEQARGQQVDHRTNIWSLGVVLYEMLAGQQPFRGENLLSISRAISEGEPESLTGPSSSARSAVARALSKKTVQRYQSVDDLLGELRKLQRSPTVVTSAQPDIPSIAVLPFADMSPDNDQEYFCDGLSEELIDAFAKLDGLSVVARTSAFQFRGKGHDLREVGEKLKVKTVLEGSVRKAGNRLRVNVQLINAADGYHLWSERFDRTLEDVFEVQDEIARSVVEKLKVKLLGARGAPLVQGPTDNLEAYNLWLRGRHYAQRLTSPTESLECYTQAVAIAPGYAKAHAGVARANAQLAILGWASPREVMPTARDAARRALALDDAEAEAHSALALVLRFYDWDWAGAARGYLRALELSPGDARTHSIYADMLACLGRADEAIVEARHAVELDPMSALSRRCLSVILLMLRQFDAARDEARRTVDLDPTYVPGYWDLAFVAVATGDLQGAVSTLRQVRQPARDDLHTGFLTQMCARFSPQQVSHAVERGCGCARARESAVKSSIAQSTAACTGPAFGGGPARRQPVPPQGAEALAFTGQRTMNTRGTRPGLSPTFYRWAEPSLTVQPLGTGRPLVISAVYRGPDFPRACSSSPDTDGVLQPRKSMTMFDLLAMEPAKAAPIPERNHIRKGCLAGPAGWSANEKRHWRYSII